MKKVTLLAMMAMVAGAASAQYTCDPETKTVLDAGKVANLQYIALDEASVNAFKAQGATVQQFGPNGTTNQLMVWPDGTSFTAGDAAAPGVGMHFDGYASLVVGSLGWSGAGYNIAEEGAMSTENWTDDTHFHLAYMSPGTVCPSVGIVVADGTDIGSMPAKIALGTAYNDNGVVFPAVAPAPTDDWQGIDITFGQLKKLWPQFNPKATEAWSGNIMSFVCGGVTGQTIAFDAVYYYTPATDGIADATVDNNWVVTSRTINVAGAQGIVLFDLTGKAVKTVEGCTMGIEELPAGVYVARSGNSARKIVK